jgi:hypothetical protein
MQYRIFHFKVPALGDRSQARPEPLLLTQTEQARGWGSPDKAHLFPESGLNSMVAEMGTGASGGAAAPQVVERVLLSLCARGQAVMHALGRMPTFIQLAGADREGVLKHTFEQLSGSEGTVALDQLRGLVCSSKAPQANADEVCHLTVCLTVHWPIMIRNREPVEPRRA